MPLGAYQLPLYTLETNAQELPDTPYCEREAPQGKRCFFCKMGSRLLERSTKAIAAPRNTRHKYCFCMRIHVSLKDFLQNRVTLLAHFVFTVPVS